MTRPLRIGNCSGFYGDRLSAMREMVEGTVAGEPLDVVCGDYLAELTMLILGRDAIKDPALGYARTFVTQVEDCLGAALERGVRIVSNAGGLNAAGLAERVREVARGLGLDPAVAHVEGDDLRSLDLDDGGYDGALTANAYLGGFGIAAALRAGADVVVTGRVTDASLVLGPAVAHHGWTPADHDALAGATVAGHVVECGTQATGGNFSGFLDLERAGAPMDVPLGFPVAEVAADGSSVITKPDGTGGAVTVDTVTAQLLYEIGSAHYAGPDVTTDLASVRLEQAGPDRVAVTGVRGQPPPSRLKVCVNELGGHRNAVELVITGLDVEEKAAWVRRQLEPRLTARTVVWSAPTPRRDHNSEEGASTLLRCTVTDPSPDAVGKAFTQPVVELALGSYPGFSLTGPPGRATPYGVYRPAFVDRGVVEQVVVHADGRREPVADHGGPFAEPDADAGRRPSPYPAPADTITCRVPLGTFVHARSGDKGGDANLGLWVVHDDYPAREARVRWLAKLMNPTKVRELVPEARDLDVDVFCLPNLGAVNVVLHGLLGEGVAASTRFDPQAKGLGEWVRSRLVHVQEDLL